MFLAQPARAQAQVGEEQQVGEVGMVQAKKQAAEQVMQLVQEIPRPEQIRAQGSVLFQPDLRPGPPLEFPVRFPGVHWCAAPQQAPRRQGAPLQ